MGFGIVFFRGGYNTSAFQVSTVSGVLSQKMPKNQFVQGQPFEDLSIIDLLSF